MHTDLPNHPQAFIQMHCGIFQFPRPSLGAWVALRPRHREREPARASSRISPAENNGGPANYGSSFLPGDVPGHADRPRRLRRRSDGGAAAGGQPQEPASRRAAQQRVATRLRSVAQPERARGPVGENPEIEGLIASYELAFRMQGELPKLMDSSQESAATLKLYGIDGSEAAEVARRLQAAAAGRAASAGSACSPGEFVEAGVRFVEVTIGGWDHHRNLKDCADQQLHRDRQADRRAARRPEAARPAEGHAGHLGRRVRPHADAPGRRPRPQRQGYTIWMAGGGVKAGLRATARPTTTASRRSRARSTSTTGTRPILHLLGLDHEKLTYRYAGRDMRLTDVKGNVVKEIVA